MNEIIEYFHKLIKSLKDYKDMKQPFKLFLSIHMINDQNESFLFLELNDRISLEILDNFLKYENEEEDEFYLINICNISFISIEYE